MQAAVADQQSPYTQYVEKMLPEKVSPKTLWLTKDIQAAIYDLIGHPYASARIRYWEAADTQVWILNEIGKEKNITAGFTLKQGKIIDAQVIEFRESRGWQIKNKAFTDQFVHVFLEDGKQLSRHIDGISGATLSVRAMQKMAKLALYLTTHTLSTPL